MPGTLFVISAPSGAGKTTITSRLAAEKVARVSVSCTTRQPRPGEKNGVQYFFMERREFEEMRDRGEFLEWAEVYGHLYGTPERQVREQVERGNSVILEIDVQGAMQVRKKMPEAKLIFISPPSAEALKERLESRGDSPPEQVARRLAAAEKEMAMQSRYDYVIINGELEDAVSEIRKIIIQRSSHVPHNH